MAGVSVIAMLCRSQVQCAARSSRSVNDRPVKLVAAWDQNFEELITVVLSLIVDANFQYWRGVFIQWRYRSVQISFGQPVSSGRTGPVLLGSERKLVEAYRVIEAQYGLENNLGISIGDVRAFSEVSNQDLR
jgi:hypothetical protein